MNFEDGISSYKYSVREMEVLQKKAQCKLRLCDPGGTNFKTNFLTISDN